MTKNTQRVAKREYNVSSERSSPQADLDACFDEFDDQLAHSRATVWGQTPCTVIGSWSRRYPTRTAPGDKTDNESLQAEGQNDQAEANVKQAGDKAKDAAGDVKDALK